MLPLQEPSREASLFCTRIHKMPMKNITVEHSSLATTANYISQPVSTLTPQTHSFFQAREGSSIASILMEVYLQTIRSMMAEGRTGTPSGPWACEIHSARTMMLQRGVC